MNQISPLYKIALLLCSSVCLQICCTPPTAPPTESEREKFDSAGDVVEIHLPRALHGKVPIIQQCFAHALILLESTSILASELYPRLADLAGPIVVAKPNVIHITPTFIVATTVMIAAALARLACYHALGNLFTFQLAIRKEHRLVTSGPYAIVRHPGYTAFLVFEIAQLATQFGRGSWWYESGYWGSWFGRASALGWMWLIGNASWFFVTRAEQEDQVLQREFGKEWDRWSKRTPYKLVPYIW